MPAYFLNSCGVQILARNQPHYCGGTNFTHYLPNSSGQSLLSHNMLLSLIGQRGKISPIYKLLNDISIQRTCQYYFYITRSLWDCWGALVWNCGCGGLAPAWFFQSVNNPDGQSCWGCTLPFPQGTSEFGRTLIQLPFLTWRFPIGLASPSQAFSASYLSHGTEVDQSIAFGNSPPRLKNRW